jgi:SpoVK/Ycf46/Vps4 family AAA+-type ATPase
LSELLTQMDGMSSDSFGTILVIAATNNLQLIDPALLRSGRFDRIVTMPLPGQDSRYAIIMHYLQEKPLSDLMHAKSALEALAVATEGFNCADLKNMINECTIAATRAAVALRKQNDRRRRPAKGNVSPGIISFQIDASHFLAAFDSVYAKIKKERPQDPLLSRKALASVLAPLHAQEALTDISTDPD